MKENIIEAFHKSSYFMQEMAKIGRGIETIAPALDIESTCSISGCLGEILLELQSISCSMNDIAQAIREIKEE